MKSHSPAAVGSGPTSVAASMSCAHELMVAALDILDQLEVSGEVGACLNQSIELLRGYMPEPLPPLKMVAI